MLVHSFPCAHSCLLSCLYTGSVSSLEHLLTTVLLRGVIEILTQNLADCVVGWKVLEIKDRGANPISGCGNISDYTSGKERE